MELHSLAHIPAAKLAKIRHPPKHFSATIASSPKKQHDSQLNYWLFLCLCNILKESALCDKLESWRGFTWGVGAVSLGELARFRLESWRNLSVLD